MIHREAQLRGTGRRAAAALLLLVAASAAGAGDPPAPEARIDPVRLLTVGLSEAERLEVEASAEAPEKFLVVATMKPFRITSGDRISTDRAELEASFFPGTPAKVGERFYSRPVRVDGRLRVHDESGSTAEWVLEPANFAEWAPMVTYDRAQARVNIIAPVAILDVTGGHRVPILLVLNCSPSTNQLVCYRAGSVLEESIAARRARPNDPVDALGLHWEARERSGAESGAEAPEPESRR